jgi:hypothetical protein
MKLGKREVEEATCPPGKRDVLIFDSEIKGFALRVTDKGTKTFLFQYRRGDRVRRLRLGEYGDLTPAQARKLAETNRGKVAAGGDPVAERSAVIASEEEAVVAAKLARKADALTFGVLIDRWEAKQLRHRRDRYRVEATRALRTSLASLSNTPAREVDADTLARALDGIPSRRNPSRAGKSAEKEGTPTPPPPLRGETMVRRVRAYGHAMYGWAVKRGLVPSNPFAAVPVEGRDTPRERVLTDAELGEVWRAAGGLGWPWASYLRVLLLTLQREAETAGMRWAELSPDLALWELPGSRTKNRKPHLVHLVPEVRAILAEAPRLAGSELVFTTTGTTPISGFAKAKLRLDAAIVQARADAAAEAGTAPAALVPWRLHDFRRTGVTALARLGVRWEVADKVLNHVQGAIRGVAAIYQRHEFMEERERAMATWARHVQSASVTAASSSDREA